MIPIDQEPDRVPNRPVVTSAVIVLVAIAACVGVTVLLAGRQVGQLARSQARPPTRIETELFASTTEAEAAHAAARQRLASWGWVDRAAGHIHVPIDVATELYLDEQGSEP